MGRGKQPAVEALKPWRPSLPLLRTGSWAHRQSSGAWAPDALLGVLAAGRTTPTHLLRHALHQRLLVLQFCQGADQGHHDLRSHIHAILLACGCRLKDGAHLHAVTAMRAQQLHEQPCTVARTDARAQAACMHLCKLAYVRLWCTTAGGAQVKTALSSQPQGICSSNPCIIPPLMPPLSHTHTTHEATTGHAPASRLFQDTRCPACSP